MMMISEKVAQRLNEQVQHEHFSSYLYLGMAYQLENMSFRVFAQWFFAQAQEERTHAEKIANYLLEQGAEVTLESIEKPRSDFKSVREIVEASLEHELLITREIHEINKMARDENDPATEVFIQWFVSEQVEEVNSVKEVLDIVKMADTPGQLLVLEDRVAKMVAQRQAAPA